MDNLRWEDDKTEEMRLSKLRAYRWRGGQTKVSSSLDTIAMLSKKHCAGYLLKLLSGISFTEHSSSPDPGVLFDPPPSDNVGYFSASSIE